MSSITFSRKYGFTYNVSAPSIYDAVKQLNQTVPSDYTTGTPTRGGTCTINGEYVGNYDVHIVNGSTIINSGGYNHSFFTNTEDTASAFVIVRGDLTISDNTTVGPMTRKLFTVIYVTGTIIIAAGSKISMTGRGANHSTQSGSGIPARNIQILPYGLTISAQGAYGSGGVNLTANTPEQYARCGFNGSNGQNGILQTGGGASGFNGYNIEIPHVHSGAHGTCFSGGSGGESSGSQNDVLVAPELNGGRGGYNASAFETTHTDVAFFGAGNNKYSVQDISGTTLKFLAAPGTGGILIVISESQGQQDLKAGCLESKGSRGRPESWFGGYRGGGSGGGVVCLVANTIYDIANIPFNTIAVTSDAHLTGGNSVDVNASGYHKYGGIGGSGGRIFTGFDALPDTLISVESQRGDILYED